ncbi:MAG: hypothetical protein U9Q82_08205 [Chloroflexota bacterium]|nr:hypothetical protein [Chloroflexota bacterium]
MPNDKFQDPMEGKGEEMIPDRGLPFDDIDESPNNDIRPEEIFPDFPEGGTASPQEEIQPEEAAESQPPAPEAIPAPEAEEHPDTASKPLFEFPDEESEAIIGDVEKSFEMEAIPWDLSEEETDELVGDAAEAFTFSKPDQETKPPAPPIEAPIGAPPEDIEDAGMSTHREDDPEEIAKLFSEAAFQPPGPSVPEGIFIPDQGEEAEASQPMIDLLVLDDTVKSLWLRADQAQKNVTEQISTLYIAQSLLDHIQVGREQLMVGKENYEDAERHINEVEYRLQLNTKLEEWSHKLIPGLFIYLAIWSIALITILIIMGDQLFASTATRLTYLIGSMIWGGIGGAVGAVLPLIKHFSEDQDFSKQHSWWYYASPFTGTAMGAIIYLFVSAGVLSMAAGDIESPVIIYIMAGLSGYQHNIFTDLIKRMLKVLDLGDDKETQTEEHNSKEKK